MERCISLLRPRWQLVPGYLAAILLAAALVRSDARYTAASLALALGSAALCWALPLFRLPAPTGPLAVGTCIKSVYTGAIHWGGTQQSGRELVVQLWYPANPVREPRACYRRRAETTRLSSYQAVLPCHASWNAPVCRNGAPFPVILFSPAWGGRRTQNTFLTEELASHGYLVAAIDHPGNSGPMQLTNGQVLAPVQKALGDRRNGGTAALLLAGDCAVAESAADLRLVLDALALWNASPDSPFHEQIDANVAGAAGHSFGGARAVAACLQDHRIHAALDLDGWLFGGVRQRPMGKPLMVMQEAPDHEALHHATHDAIDRTMDEEFQRVLDDSFAVAGGLHLQLRGATHAAFTDRALFSPLRRLSGNGALSASRTHGIVRAYAVAFFDAALRGRWSPLLREQPSPFPEVALQIFPGLNDRSVHEVAGRQDTHSRIPADERLRGDSDK